MHIKENLYQQCNDFVNNRLESIQQAINDAQASANNETKSTAGDKHDTSRAMMQLEVEQKSKQLAEVKKLKAALTNFGPETNSNKVELGSIVRTSAANYYLSISAGKLIVEDELYFAISGASPIGQLLMGKKVGETISFNGKDFQITELI